MAKSFPPSIPIPILISLFFFFFFFFFLLLHSHAIKFEIQNRCSYTIWPAADPGGGRRLDPGETWTLSFPDDLGLAKFWARTNCTFDASGKGRCLTGDCGNQLQCPPNTNPSPPYTLVDYGLIAFARKDMYDVSVLQGFNLPIELVPTSNGCTRSVRCGSESHIIEDCPVQLRVSGGCNNPCTVFKTTEYCCGSGDCKPTDLSRYFKNKCPDVFTFPWDDPTASFSCPPVTNYRIVFCPN